jgi:hypothetical protein
MDKSKKQLITNRLLTGVVYLKVGKQLYKQIPPTKDQRALADLFYTENLNNVKYDSLISRDQATFMLQKTQIWGPLHEKQLEDYKTYLEDLKIQLYKAVYNKKDQKALRRKIKGANKSIEKAYTKKFSLETMTFEYHCELLRRDFLIALCIRDSSDDPVYTYENFWESDGGILTAFTGFHDRNVISQEEFREIARTEPFRSAWVLGKENMFGISASELEEDQKSIILYSRMYDSAYENPDRPSEEVIEDDDMFDGWMAKSRREAEKDRTQREVEQLLGNKGVGKHNIGNAGEMFVVADSKEEAEKIKELNDLNSRMKLEHRIKAIEKSGKLEESQLPDVKLDLRNQAMKQMSEKR